VAVRGKTRPRADQEIYRITLIVAYLRLLLGVTGTELLVYKKLLFDGDLEHAKLVNALYPEHIPAGSPSPLVLSFRINLANLLELYHTGIKCKVK
jgi:hypothetical protein